MTFSMFLRRFPVALGLFLVSACAASGPSGSGAAIDPGPSAGPVRVARTPKTQAIDPYDSAFREHSWLCTLCPAAPPERYPDGCAAGQTGFALRFRPAYVTNPRPVILVPAKDLATGYEADRAQPVPSFLSGRTFEILEFSQNKPYHVSMTVTKDWVSFCSPSMDEADPADKKEPSRADL